MKPLTGGLYDTVPGGDAAILAGIRMGMYRNPPAFLSCYEGRDVFALDDFEGEALLWRYDGNDPTVSRQDVDDTLRALVMAMYEPSTMLGLPWERLSIGVFDNHRFFHGRTFVRRPVDGAARHLRQIRVFPALAPSSGT